MLNGASRAFADFPTKPVVHGSFKDYTRAKGRASPLKVPPGLGVSDVEILDVLNCTIPNTRLALYF